MGRVDLAERAGLMEDAADAARGSAESAAASLRALAGGPPGEFGGVAVADLAASAARDCLGEASSACRAAAGMMVWASDEPLEGLEPSAGSVSAAARASEDGAVRAAVLAHYLSLLASASGFAAEPEPGPPPPPEPEPELGGSEARGLEPEGERAGLAGDGW